MTIWITKHSPRSEPKFHQMEMLDGAGRSIRVWFIIFSRGWIFRILRAINSYS